MNQKIKTILVVDDEPTILKTLELFLKQKGFHVLCASNGREALNLFDTYPCDLVLLDRMLPDILGDNVCIQLRKVSRVPIIMITAKVTEKDLVDGFEMGADDYILKPFGLKELSARIEGMLRRSQHDVLPLSKKYSFNQGELRVDLDTQSVYRHQNLINLTPNEMKILHTLLAHPSRIFTREELVSIALGEDFDGYDRTIDSHIKNLRQKIETDPKHPQYILTVFGVGYRFKGEVL